MLLPLLLVTCSVTVSSAGGPYQEDYLDLPRTTCYSCASFSYLPMWRKLLDHYFPPKNFTDECFNPGSTSQRIETVPCSTACFTLVERIDQDDYPTPPDYSGVLRGCVDRLLLFGMDDDVRNVLASHTSTRVCRETERKLLRLYPLSTRTPYVTFCSCTGERCNDQEMLGSSSFHGYSLSMTMLLLFHVIL